MAGLGMDPIAEDLDEDGVDKTRSIGKLSEQNEDDSENNEENEEKDANVEDLVSRPYKKEKTVTKDEEQVYDTDLEIEEEGDEFDPTGRRVYLAACKKLGLIPVSYFLRHMLEEVLNLGHHGLGSLGVQALSYSLQNNTSVVNLDLSDNWLEGPGGEHVAEMLKENCYITEMNLSDNKLGGQGLAAISKMLENNTYLRSINLSGNEFTDHHAHHVAEALNENMQLMHLNLSHNEFGEKAGEILGVVLAENETLEELDLSWNSFRKKSIVMLCKGIAENTRLRVVNLSMNGLGNEGAISVAGIIKDNNNLQELYISYNRIGRQGALAIGKELESNETLKVLKMDHNPIGSDAANAVLRGVFPAKSSLFDLDLSAVEVDKEFLSLLKEIKSTRCVNVCHGSVIGDYKLKWKPKKRFPEGQLFMVPIEEVTPSNLMSVIRKYSDEYNVQVYEAVVSLDKENVGRVGKATLIEALKVAEIGFSESQKEALENVIGDLPPEETLDYSALKQ